MGGYQPNGFGEVLQRMQKLPQWKASEFFQHLDKARVESLFDDIGIDALSQFQRCLGQVNIKAPSIDKLPSAVSTWLFEILEANADNRDLLVDGTAFQPEFELLDDLPLAEGHISSGKLHLGRSAVAWRKSPSPPESPDFNVKERILHKWNRSTPNTCTGKSGPEMICPTDSARNMTGSVGIFTMQKDCGGT